MTRASDQTLAVLGRIVGVEHQLDVLVLDVFHLPVLTTLIIVRNDLVVGAALLDRGNVHRNGPAGGGGGSVENHRNGTTTAGITRV